MVFKYLVALILVLVIGLSTNYSLAKTADEECGDVQAAIPEVSCKVCGNCAVVTLRTGEKVCKQCNEFQCDKIECSKCSDSKCATQ